MENKIFKLILLSVFVVFIALFMGIKAATAQEEAVIIMIGAISVAVCMLMGARVWLLIPLLGTMDIVLRIPGLPTSMLISQFATIPFCIILFMMRKLPYRFNFTEIEGWGLLIMLFIVQVYMRNPVGVNIFGGATVGGKPYALVAIDLLTAIILCGLVVTPKDLKLYLKLSIIGGAIGSFISILGSRIPALAYMTGASYANQGETDYSNHGKVVDTTVATRHGYMDALAKKGSLWVVSFISPLHGLLHARWLFLILLVLGCATMSGYRNAIVMVGMTFIVGLCYRSGFSSLIAAMFLGASGVVFLAIGNLIVPLPPNVQRTLTFLPGTWDEKYRVDASKSTQWRYEMWVEALTSEKWIKNKWIGDGLGFTADALARSMNASKAIGISGFDSHRESILINGDFHSGPVQTIRTVGYVGLFFLIIAQFRLAVHAHRQIMRCKNTEWFPLALFVGVPLVFNPVYFIFVFGAFNAAVSTLLIGGSIVRMLEKNLPLPAWQRTTNLPSLVGNKKYI